MRRVVITGMGILSALGDKIPTFWENIRNGQHCIRPITRFDTSNIQTRLGCELHDFKPELYGIDPREARRMDRFCQYGMAAANMALEDAGTNFADYDPFRRGIIMSTGIGGIETTLNEQAKMLQKGGKWVSPLFIPMMIPNMAAGTIAIQHNFKGANMNIATACATSAHSVGEAFRRIKHGYEDVMLAGGCEAPFLELAVAGFENMQALSTATDPNRASIPFDKERSGFIMGEGAAALVLEEMEQAKARGAKIYGEICGYGATDDAYHITGPDPEGLGLTRAIQQAMEEGGINAEEIGYINAHGTSTGPNDRIETLAIKNAFGSRAKAIGVSSTKSMTGHLLGAAGGAEAIITLLALRDGVMPPTAGYQVPDPDCDLDYVTEGARPANIRAALSNSLGFGGHNAVLCFRKEDGSNA